ncbi:MAG: hypothetical protein AAF564_15750 [Bacteroidota bacterium]
MAESLKEGKPTLAFNQLYEIGCGHWQVLGYLTALFPSKNSFVGIDVIAEQTKKNRQNYTNEKMQFVAADAGKWFIVKPFPKVFF